jgi:hypothetical protein
MRACGRTASERRREGADHGYHDQCRQQQAQATEPFRHALVARGAAVPPAGGGEGRGEDGERPWLAQEEGEPAEQRRPGGKISVSFSASPPSFCMMAMPQRMPPMNDRTIAE